MAQGSNLTFILFALPSIKQVVPCLVVDLIKHIHFVSLVS